MFAFVSHHFAQVLSRTRIDIPAAALHYAKNIAFPDLDVDTYLSKIEWLAATFKNAVAPTANSWENAKNLAAWLYQEQGFRGNMADYANPRNSFFNEVLDTGFGLPIALSEIYVAVAAKLKLSAHGVGLPGHYIVGVRSGSKTYMLDPFNGGEPLTREACVQLVRNTIGYRGVFKDGRLLPTTPRETLTRMLTNLRNVYIQQENWAQAIAVIEHMCVTQPETASFWRDLGIIWNRNGDKKRSIYCMEAYLLRTINPEDRMQVQARINDLVESFSKLN